MAIFLEDEGSDSNGFDDGLPLTAVDQPSPGGGKKGLESVRINSILTSFQQP